MSLAYCTNVHPAESWEETFLVLKTDVLAVRDQLREKKMELPESELGFAIGLRLSACAAEELFEEEPLEEFADWLEEENCHVFTINGFPYGAFHNTSVKEKVYLPDWTSRKRLDYTLNLCGIIATLCPEETGGSVSTLPGSFKEFAADEFPMFENLYACADFLEQLAEESGKDLHLGLEPEPMGHFENLEETLVFFQRFERWCEDEDLDPEILYRRIGVNYDTCHFALEFEDCEKDLKAFEKAGIRISKIHLSNALSFDPSNPEALTALRAFEEPTYLHQVLLKEGETITRHRDLPEFFASIDKSPTLTGEGRCHFHIPLYSEPTKPLRSTRNHAADVLSYLKIHPEICRHLEIETYTWGVLPTNLQRPLTDQIVEEYRWVLERLAN